MCVWPLFIWGGTVSSLLLVHQIGRCDRLGLILTSFGSIQPSRVVSNDINVNTQTGIHQLVTQPVYERVVHELTAH